MAMARRESIVIKVRASSNYDITINNGLNDYAAQTIKEQTIVLISDEHVFPIYGSKLIEALKNSGKNVFSYVVAAGEKSKSAKQYISLLSQLVNDGIDRDAAVLALGGGVVGDLAGFVAASYMRGISFYQMPSSLLAMVDAAIGGKTAINIPEGKNLVGAFWQPKEVFVDIDFLASLSEKEFKQGAAEHFKHGLIANSEILNDIDDPDFRANGNKEKLAQMVAKSAAVKANIVSIDEREQGKRAFLNLGHNIAHAIEAASQHAIAHGDAVAYGLVFDSYLSYKRGYKDLRAYTTKFLEWLKPASMDIEFARLEPFLAADKKTKAKIQHFILLEDLEKPIIVNDISPSELKEAWDYLKDVS